MGLPEVFWKSHTDLERKTPDQEAPKPERRTLTAAFEGLRGLGGRLKQIFADTSAAEAIAVEGGEAFRQEIADKARSMVEEMLQSGGEFLEGRAVAARNALAKPAALIAGWRERSAQRAEFAELRRIVADQEERLFRTTQEIDLFEHRRHDRHIRENVDGAYYARALAKGNLEATAKVAEQSELYFDPNQHNATYMEAYHRGDIKTMLLIDSQTMGTIILEPRTLLQQMALQKSILLSTKAATEQRLQALRSRLAGYEQERAA